jgi:hypothetical protein
MVQGLTNPRNIMPAGLGAGRRPPPPGPPTKQPQWGFAPARNRLRDFARISLGRSAPLRGRGPGGWWWLLFCAGFFLVARFLSPLCMVGVGTGLGCSRALNVAFSLPLARHLVFATGPFLCFSLYTGILIVIMLRRDKLLLSLRSTTVLIKIIHGTLQIYYTVQQRIRSLGSEQIEQTTRQHAS